MFQERRMEARRSGADRRVADRRTLAFELGVTRRVAHAGFGGERRHGLRRYDYRRSLFNRRSG
jgi:hypothetical protein